MYSWQFQKALRESASWIHTTWSERYDRKPEINWVPWVITAGNNDTNPKYPQKDAEKIFQTLKDRGMLAYIPVTVVTAGEQTIQTANLSVVNETQWVELKDDKSFFRVYVWPIFFSLWNHPKTAVLFAFVVSVFVMFFSHWVEIYSKYQYERLWPSTPASQSKGDADGSKPS